ncbi:MAG: hypothetical protein VX460_15125 [Planctomycetota bacterium]|nr:hypothetical protein [Planctomycetota bacterium]
MRHRRRVRSSERFAGLAVAIVAGLVLLWGTRCGRVEASVGDGLDRWSARVTAASGLPARAAREFGGVVTLRIGAMKGPTAAVLVDAGRAAQGVTSVEQLARRAARAGLDPRSAAILAVVVPREDRADARERSTSAARNFPWRWEEARRAHGASAGVMPGELPWVAGTSDALLKSPDIVGVVDARDLGPDGAANVPAGPGTLKGLVEGRIGAPYVLDGSAEAALRLAIDLPRVRIHGEVWRRVGPRTWIVDFAVDGGEGAETPSAPCAPSELSLELHAADARARIAAFAAADGPSSALEIVPLRHGRARPGTIAAGAERRCRAVIVMPEGAAGAPSLTVEASSNSLLGAALTMAPPASSGSESDHDAPSGGASRGSDGGSSK